MQEEAREGRWTPTARRDGDRATWRSAADGRSFASHFPEEVEPEKHPHLGASVAAATGSATRRPASDEGQLSHPTPPHRNRVGQPSPAQAVEPTSSGAPFADSGGTCGKTTRFLPSSRPSTSGRRCHTADHNNHHNNRRACEHYEDPARASEGAARAFSSSCRTTSLISAGQQPEPVRHKGVDPRAVDDPTRFASDQLRGGTYGGRDPQQLVAHTDQKRRPLHPHHPQAQPAEETHQQNAAAGGVASPDNIVGEFTRTLALIITATDAAGKAIERAAHIATTLSERDQEPGHGEPPPYEQHWATAPATASEGGKRGSAATKARNCSAPRTAEGRAGGPGNTTYDIDNNQDRQPRDGAANDCNHTIRPHRDEGAGNQPTHHPASKAGNPSSGATTDNEANGTANGLPNPHPSKKARTGEQ